MQEDTDIHKFKIGYKTILDLYNEILKDLQSERKGESKKEAAVLQNELSTVQKRINSIEDKYLDGDLTKEQYNRMLERYIKEASAMQQQIEMRENPNRGNIEPKLNYSINLINNIDNYIRNLAELKYYSTLVFYIIFCPSELSAVY